MTSYLESLFDLQLTDRGITFEKQFKFHPARKWRADYCLPGKILVEIEGGTWTRGRHVRGKGFENGCEKMNTAQLMGYKVFRFTTDMVQDGRAIGVIQEALAIMETEK